MNGPPVVCVCGKKNSGKTTLMEKLIHAFGAMGIEVATLKHDRHGFDMDVEGKDTWRHRKAGAKAVAIASPWSVAMVKSVEKEPSIDELAGLVSEGSDLVLAEGFKTSSKPKIEVVRSARSSEPICTEADALLAVATDVDTLEVRVPRFHIDDAKGIAAFLAERFSLLARGRDKA